MPISETQKKPELLSPAGSIECFHAAVEAGANAVYLGVDDFNARLRAKNFTVKTVSHLVPYARKRTVKIYITLNTQIKTTELEKLIHLLYQLSQIGVDGIIAADLGLIRIVRSNFPKLKVHASTQMAIHNSAQLDAVSKMGICRAVLARELSLKEILFLQKNSPVELEIFVHGALCYCVSGFCLASSFLGGASGNRGRCTQVCRRKFTGKSFDGYFFSPDDFCAIDYIDSFSKAGIASFKIEGRMKGAEYVYKVVSSYRKALDNPQEVGEIKEALKYDFGRPKTTFFLDSTKKDNIINHETLSGTGIYAGKISGIGDGVLFVKSDETIDSGDRIRIQPDSGFDGEVSSVKLAVPTQDGYEITPVKEIKCSKGDSVYIIGKSSKDILKSCSLSIQGKPAAYNTFCGNAMSILRKSSPVPQKPNRSANVLWIKIDNAKWLDILTDTPCQHLVFAGDINGARALLDNDEKLRMWRSRLTLALPPYIAENDLPLWRGVIRQAELCGVRRWACLSVGQETLFKKKDVTLIADNPIGVLNSVSQSVIGSCGFSFFTYSIEDEYLNLKRSVSSRGILYIYSHVPLFISKIKPQIPQGEIVTDPLKNSFFCKSKNGLHYLLSAKPLCLTGKYNKLKSLGVHHFCIDFSFVEPDVSLMRSVIGAYKDGVNISGCSMFNFKAGLK
ncbi:MAG: peptidase U32 family protein [Fibrobacter sp.]|nr:peptidase U32 family protein [Fibrobacter sp.]